MRTCNRHAADYDLTLSKLGDVRHLLLQLLDGVHDLLGMLDEAGSGMGKLNVARIALEQQHAELFLQLGELLAQGRLGDMKLLRGSGKFLSAAICSVYCSCLSSI